MILAFFESFVMRAVVSTFVLCLPVFFAGIIFVSSFADAHFWGSALGSNLFGSMAGGLLESLSLWFGLRSLTLLAVMIYVGSALVLVVRKRGAERAHDSLTAQYERVYLNSFQEQNPPSRRRKLHDGNTGATAASPWMHKSHHD